MFEMENGVDHPLGAPSGRDGLPLLCLGPQSDKVELCLFRRREQELARLPCPVGGQYWFGHVRGGQDRSALWLPGAWLSPRRVCCSTPGQAADKPHAHAQPLPPTGTVPPSGDSAQPWWASRGGGRRPSDWQGSASQHPAGAGVLRPTSRGSPYPWHPQGVVRHWSGHQPPADDRGSAGAGVTSSS